MRISIYIMFLILALTACAPDPRKEADAYATRIQAEQDALNSEQARLHNEDLHVIQLQEQVLEQGHREATKQEWRAGLNTMIRWGFGFGTFALCLVLVGAAVSSVYSAMGTAKAMVHMANVKANLIYLDPATHQFPLFHHVHGDRFAMHNPNDGSVVMLDLSQAADRQKIAGANATQMAGEIANQARQSSDPAGVSIVRPVVIDAEEEGLTVGMDIYRRRNE